MKEKAMEMMLALNGPGGAARHLCRAGHRDDSERGVIPELVLA